MRAVFFDFDNTFYDYRPCHHFGLNSAAKWAFQKKIYSSKTQFIKDYKRVRKQIQKQIPDFGVKYDRTLYFQRLIEKKLGHTEPNSILRLYEVYWNSFLAKMRIEKGAIDLLRLLRKSKIKIGIVTDLTAHIQFRKLIKLKLARYIDYLTVTEEVGYAKPIPNVLKLALKKLMVHPKDCCFVGDNLASDIALANRFKMKSIWFRRDAKEKARAAKPDFIISNFKELGKVLATI